MRKLAPTIFHTLAITILVASPTTLLADGNPQSGKTKAYTCTGCHGIPGYKNTYPTYHVPRLGGQNPVYIKAALTAYRSGERDHGTMALQAESLSATDIDDIATWLATEGGDSAGPSGPVVAAGPEKAQACVACHGADGMGSDPSYPVLAGQHASYLSQALRGYRDGKRRNAIMGGMAAGLSDTDIDELALYYQAMDGLKDL